MSTCIGWWIGSILTRCVRCAPSPSSCCAPAPGTPTPARPKPRSPGRCWPTSRCGTSPSSAFSTVHRISPSAPRTSCARSSRSAPMLIADTGPLVAMLNAKDQHHEACTTLFRRYRGPIIVPAPIVTEVAYFLQIEPGPAVGAAFLDALARGELIVEATTSQDFARMADLVRQYADFPLGTADASVIAVAERLGATRVAVIGPQKGSAAAAARPGGPGRPTRPAPGTGPLLADTAAPRGGTGHDAPRPANRPIQPS